MARGCVKIIIGVCFLILAISVLFFIFVWPEEKKKATALLVYHVDKAAAAFNADFGKPPPDDPAEFAAALRGRNDREKVYLRGKQVLSREGRFTDYWRRDLLIEKNGPDGNLTVRSTGPDGIAGNGDDIGPADIWLHYPEEKPGGNGEGP